MLTEIEKLRAERDALHALVLRQFDDLASMRRELDAMHERLAELNALVKAVRSVRPTEAAK